MSTPSNITPADLARFVHPVPVGATIPVGMEFATIVGTGVYQAIALNRLLQLADDPPRWTAEPLAAPKPPLTERVREFAEEVLNAPPVGFSSVILDTENQQNRWIAEAAAFLAEIAERLDADEITSWSPARIVADEAVTAPSVNVGSLKMAREALCMAEHMMLKGLATPAQIGQIGAMIADIDRQRPVGPDGRHGSRHTATCGCEDR